MKIEAFLTLAFLAAFSASATSQESKKPPNILVLLTDDQRADALSAMGATNVRTPNMDRVIESGVTFTRAYCQGSWHGAVCIPSRAMLLTGRRLGRVGAQLGKVRLLPEHLKASGYHTFGTGKWHNGRRSFKRSFRHGSNVFFGGMCDHEKVKVVEWDGEEYQNPRVGEEFSSTLFANAAVRFLEEYEREAPFFAWVSFTAPHDPRQPREEWLARVPEAAADLPPNFLPQHPFNNGWLIDRDEALCPWPRPENLVRSTRREYVAMIEHLDGQIGRILDALEQRGDADRTIVVLASDHGLAVGSHGLLGKQNLYEHSQRAILALRGPGIPQGKRTASLTYLYDLPVTLLSLAGRKPLPDVDGLDLSPVLRGEKERLREALFTRFAAVQRAITTERYKLIRYPQIHKTQLFDLAEDPHEMNDLADHPDHAERRAALEARLQEMQKAAGDDVPFTSARRNQVILNLTGRSRKPDRWQPKSVVEKYFKE